MLAGRPDWHAPMHIESRHIESRHIESGHLLGRQAFAVYEQPGHFQIAPVELSAFARDREPPLQLDVYRQDRGDAGLHQFSMLSIAFAAEYDFGSLHDAMLDSGEGPHVAPLAAERGWLRLTTANALDLPAELHALQPLDVLNISSMGMTLRLDSAATDLFVAALQRGLMTIGADAWISVCGVAERIPLQVVFNPASLLSAVHAIAQDEAAIALDALRTQLTAAPQTFGFDSLASLQQAQRAQAADALIDRFCSRFASPQPDLAADTAAVRIVFDPAQMPAGTLSWDLSEPVLVPRIFGITADPLGPLRALPAAQWAETTIRRHDVRALESGWHSVAISQNLPARRVGMLRAQVELSASPHLPARAFTAKATARLQHTREPLFADLRLSPIEPLKYRWKTSVFVLADGRGELIEGPQRESDREHLLIGPDDFGVHFVAVESDPAFLQEARIKIECSGRRNDRSWSIRSIIDTAAPDIALAIPRDVVDAQIHAIAIALAGDGECTMAPVPAANLRLDAFSFEGSGRRDLAVECVFDDDKPQALIEWVAEGREDEPSRLQSVRLTPLVGTARCSWVALSPFRSGYRWRWHGRDMWSEVRDPADALMLRSSEAP